MELRTYATFEEMHRRKSTLQEIIERLSVFSCESVLYTCSVTATILKLWERGGWAKENYNELIDGAFEFLRGDWYKLAMQMDEGELVFHRRQLLLLMKLALEHCPEVGQDLMRARRGIFGTILLMASDQFHYGLYPFPGAAEGDEYEKISRVTAEFLPVNEYSGFRVEGKLTRAHLLMTRYAQALKVHPDFVDIPAEFERLTGISFPDYEALTFGLMTRTTVMVTLKALRANAWIAGVRPENFYTTAIPQATIHSFLKEFSGTPSGLLADIQKARMDRRDYGANDFTVFRKKPLIQLAYGCLPADVIFAIEKLESGPYWRVNDTDTATGDKLRRFWGAVFENYVNDLFKAGIAGLSGLAFTPDPRLIDRPSEQLCDGLLVEGDALVIMEYKSSMFTARAKYSGDHVRLRDEISKKLVRDSAEKKRKGVEQLAVAIETLFADPKKQVVRGLDVSGINRVYPLLITLDEVGSSLLISKMLNFSFDAVFKRNTVTGADVKPLLCTDIESIEVALPYFSMKPLSGILQQWLDNDPKLLQSLLARFPDGLPARRNAFLDKEWKELYKGISARLFPKETNEKDFDEKHAQLLELDKI